MFFFWNDDIIRELVYGEACDYYLASLKIQLIIEKNLPHKLHVF